MTPGKKTSGNIYDPARVSHSTGKLDSATPCRGRGNFFPSIYPGVFVEACAPPRHPGETPSTPAGVPRHLLSAYLVGQVGRVEHSARIHWAFTACRHPKDARSIGIGRGTKCRRPMYKRTHNATTPCGSPREGLSAQRPTRGRGGRGGLLYIGHRFADDRWLWSEHPSRGASFSVVKLKCVTPVTHSPGTRMSQDPPKLLVN